MKKKILENKSRIFEFLFILLFFLMLLSVPSFFKDEEAKPELYYHSDVESASIVLETKFKVITLSTLDYLNNKIISESRFQYVQDLLLENKISNRDNSIAQEIINLNFQNKTDIAKQLTKLYVEEKLDEFDLKEDQKWRNYLIYIEDNQTKYVLYNETNLLLDYEDAKAKSVYEISVTPYQYQKYYLKLENGDLKEIIVDLLSSNQNVLSEYINLSDTNINRNKARILDTQLISSNKEFRIKFYLWK